MRVSADMILKKNIKDTEMKKETDYYAPHNYWCKTYDSMAAYPDEDGKWIDDEQWIRQWLLDRMFYGQKPIRLVLNRYQDYNKGFYLRKRDILLKLPGWDNLKENEGYFYLKKEGTESEWIINCDDVPATYEKVMRIQDEIFKEYSG